MSLTSQRLSFQVSTVSECEGIASWLALAKPSVSKRRREPVSLVTRVRVPWTPISKQSQAPASGSSCVATCETSLCSAMHFKSLRDPKPKGSDDCTYFASMQF